MLLTSKEKKRKFLSNGSAALTFPLSPEKLCRNGDRGQRASFGSFRIAVILRLWATIPNVESDVCMVNKPMILFTKRLRSKAHSAAPLSPVQFADRRGLGLYFLPTIYYDTVSEGKGMG